MDGSRKYRIVYLSDEYFAFITETNAWLYLIKADIDTCLKLETADLRGTTVPITWHNKFTDDVQDEFAMTLPSDTYYEVFRNKKTKRWVCLKYEHLKLNDPEYNNRICEIRYIMGKIDTIIKN